ncbi:MAG: hypothetical protein R3A44_00300 [Caldilineaceae bacterium]
MTAMRPQQQDSSSQNSAETPPVNNGIQILLLLGVLTISDRQTIHVAVDPEKAERVRIKWAERVGRGELLILPSPYGLVGEPLRAYIQDLQAVEPDAFIHLMVGQLSLPDYGEQLLHQNTNLLLDLLLRDMDRVVVTSVPYQIDQRERYAERLAAELNAKAVAA